MFLQKYRKCLGTFGLYKLTLLHYKLGNNWVTFYPAIWSQCIFGADRFLKQDSNFFAR